MYFWFMFLKTPLLDFQTKQSSYQHFLEAVGFEIKGFFVSVNNWGFW